jgi:LytS/YehU family sensor histidine kinase
VIFTAPSRTVFLRILVLLAFLACILPGSLLAQTPSQQEDPTILKDKVKDLVEQVQDRDERLALRHATIAKQRFMLISLVLFTALLAVSLTVFRIRVKARQKELKYELVRAKQQALSRQMNPHFIFNTLGSFQSFILKNDRDTSNRYLTKFSQLMRHILDNFEKEFVDLEEEIRGLQLYLELQHMRFRDYFDYEVLVDPGIDQTTVRMPPFLIQPYVENAIHHGLLHREGKGKLKVELKVHDRGILWIIEDDGIGRQEAGKIAARKGEEPRLHGTEITDKRIDLLNSLSPDKFSRSIHDLTNSSGKASGTRVELFMKSLV